MPEQVQGARSEEPREETKKKKKKEFLHKRGGETMSLHRANGRGRFGGQAAGGHPKAFPWPKKPLFAVPALRELESACRQGARGEEPREETKKKRNSRTKVTAKIGTWTCLTKGSEIAFWEGSVTESV